MCDHFIADYLEYEILHDNKKMWVALWSHCSKRLCCVRKEIENVTNRIATRHNLKHFFFSFMLHDWRCRLSWPSPLICHLQLSAILYHWLVCQSIRFDYECILLFVCIEQCVLASMFPSITFVSIKHNLASLIGRAWVFTGPIFHENRGKNRSCIPALMCHLWRHIYPNHLYLCPQRRMAAQHWPSP